MAKDKAFEGATHVTSGGKAVKATHWKKDGNHPAVVRYPIERRRYKGLIEVSPKNKLALCFGDWILEDGDGNIWVERGPELDPSKYQPVP